jgi:hypothetical protein
MTREQMIDVAVQCKGPSMIEFARDFSVAALVPECWPNTVADIRAMFRQIATASTNSQQRRWKRCKTASCGVIPCEAV